MTRQQAYIPVFFDAAEGRLVVDDEGHPPSGCWTYDPDSEEWMGRESTDPEVMDKAWKAVDEAIHAWNDRQGN